MIAPVFFPSKVSRASFFVSIAPKEYTIKRMPATKLNQWSGTITTSDKIEKINQYLRLELIATSKFESRVSFEKPIEIFVQLKVRKNGKDWQKAIQTSHLRDLVCREQKRECDPIHLLEQVHCSKNMASYCLGYYHQKYLSYLKLNELLSTCCLRLRCNMTSIKLRCKSASKWTPSLSNRSSTNSHMLNPSLR